MSQNILIKYKLSHNDPTLFIHLINKNYIKKELYLEDFKRIMKLKQIKNLM